jgi:hypothetical protein
MWKLQTVQFQEFAWPVPLEDCLDWDVEVLALHGPRDGRAIAEQVTKICFHPRVPSTGVVIADSRVFAGTDIDPERGFVLDWMPAFEALFPYLDSDAGSKLNDAGWNAWLGRFAIVPVLLTSKTAGDLKTRSDLTELVANAPFSVVCVENALLAGFTPRSWTHDELRAHILDVTDAGQTSTA